MKTDDRVEEALPLIPPTVDSRWTIFAFSSVTFYIFYYALCSSTMLVINKVAIHVLPCPTFVLVCQLGSSAFFVKICDLLGLVQADSFEWEKIKKFAFVAFAFLATLYFNIKVLQFSNVETFITFRSSTPIVLTAFDYMFLGRTWPNLRSWICLVFLLLGAVGYVLVDEGFKLEGYFWLSLWYCCFVFDQVYIKHVCDNVKMTTWGRVLYTNALALLPLLCFLPTQKEHETLLEIEWGIQVLFPLALSCLVGICMSHSAYLLRDAVSATMFTVVGILCKLLTVIINVMIWDKHAGAAGLGMLGICVMAGAFYQQAPMRVS